MCADIITPVDSEWYIGVNGNKTTRLNEVTTFAEAYGDPELSKIIELAVYRQMAYKA